MILLHPTEGLNRHTTTRHEALSTQCCDGKAGGTTDGHHHRRAPPPLEGGPGSNAQRLVHPKKERTLGRCALHASSTTLRV